MYPKKDRVISLLENSIDEMDLLGKMSAEILSPDDFVTTLSGITAFRACGMSLQYITEIFVKIRNLCGRQFLNHILLYHGTPFLACGIFCRTNTGKWMPKAFSIQ